MVREKIKKLISKVVAKAIEIKIEKPEREEFGDYSTNIALQLKKDPAEIAKRIESDLGDEAKTSSSPFANAWVFEKIEVVPPGFINFFVSKEYLQKQVEEILKEKEKFGALKIGKNKKVNIEYCSANPTGPLHLGHGRGAFWGDSLSNILEKAGYKTTREYFINDYGRQRLMLGKSIDARYRESFGEKVELGEDFYKAIDITSTATAIKNTEGNKYLKFPEKERVDIFAEKGLEERLNTIKKILDKINVKYDIWFSEKSLYKKGLVKKAIELLKKKGFTYKKEEALWFTSSKLGDDKDRVLIRADGEPTYFASDVAYHLNKVSRKYDLMINGWGADHWGYKPRLMAAAKVLGFDNKLKIIVGQFVRLIKKGKEVKMSKRGGIYVTLEELIDEVGPDVARFFFLIKSVDTHIDFDLDLAKQQSEKNPVYYVQYAHARICSILRKSKMKEAKPQSDLLEHPSELKLIKQLIRLPEIVEDTAQDYQVQRLPQYAMDLAAVFHQFYRDCRVISENKELTKSRLALVRATKIVLKNTLNLMGISAPEKM